MAEAPRDEAHTGNEEPADGEEPAGGEGAVGGEDAERVGETQMNYAARSADQENSADGAPTGGQRVNAHSERAEPEAHDSAVEGAAPAHARPEVSHGAATCSCEPASSSVPLARVILQRGARGVEFTARIRRLGSSAAPMAAPQVAPQAAPLAAQQAAVTGHW